MRIGVDIGGTKIEAIRLSDIGEIESSHRAPSEMDQGSDVVMKNLISCIREVWLDGCRGIGISLPGFLEDGVVQYGPNTQPLVGLHLPDLLRKEFGVPVKCENDANCFALAEYHLGAGKEYDLMVGVIIGTGLGGGVVIDGRLLSGVSGSAAEIGHMRLLDGHDWEYYLAGPGIVRQYFDYGGTLENANPETIWQSNDEASHKTRHAIIRNTSLFIASLINAFNPDCIVLGGGVSNLPYYDDLHKIIPDFCVPGAFDSCVIRQHTISDSAGVLGAAMLIE